MYLKVSRDEASSIYLVLCLDGMNFIVYTVGKSGRVVG
jgi:hypothetical protein